MRDSFDKGIDSLALLENRKECDILYSRSNIRNDSSDDDLDLFKAAAKGKFQIIKRALIPDVDATNSDSETLLYLAATNGHSEVVRNLLERGAQPKIRNSEGQTALMAAASRDHVDVIQILCNGSYDAGINLYDFNKETSLHYASDTISCKTGIVLLSLGDKIDVDPVDSCGASPLHAITSNFRESCPKLRRLQTEFVTSLLERGVDVNRRNMDGVTPLMEASIRDNHEIVSLLLNPKYTAHINAKDNTGRTALIHAVENKSWTTIELLLCAGADVNCRDLRGNTALHTAVFFPEELQFFEMFTHPHHKQAIRTGQGYFAKTCNGIDERLMQTEKMMKLLTKYRDPNFESRDFRGRSVADLQTLGIAIRSIIQDRKCVNEYADTLKEFIRSYTDDQGNTIFHRLRVDKEYIAWNLLLLIRPVPCFTDFDQEDIPILTNEIVNLINDKGRTALHCAAMRITDTRMLFYIRWLLSEGANKNIRDIYGRIAADYDEYKIAHELIPDGDDDKNSKNSNATPLLETCKPLHPFMPPISGWDVIKRIYEANNVHLLTTIKKQNMLKLLAVECYQSNYASHIWRNGDFAFRTPESLNICEKVTECIQKLLLFVAEREPLFQSRLEMVGSAREQTKIDELDEFDFNAILVKLGDHCQVVEPTGLPIGYIHLVKRSRDKPYQNQPIDSLDRFFSKDGFLLTDEVNSRFHICIQQVLEDKTFWENERLFDLQFDCDVGERSWKPTRLCATLRLWINLPIGSQTLLKRISVDIVPCMHLDNWWPKEAIPCRNSEEIRIGCNFVFDQPQRLYLGVPYSPPCARISFAPLESKIVADSPAVARAAYMVAKQMLRVEQHTYILKTCLLYCLEAFPEKIESCSEEVTESDLNFWVRKLLKCYLLFCLQDFVPCYFMPEFHILFLLFNSNITSSTHELLKILGVKNDNGLEILRTVLETPIYTNAPGYLMRYKAIYGIVDAYRLYWSVCDDETEVEFSLPDPEEDEDKSFQRSDLLRKIRSNAFDNKTATDTIKHNTIQNITNNMKALSNSCQHPSQFV